ncbi:hypothetical protein V6Z93_000931 [Aspergillus fumigatus]
MQFNSLVNPTNSKVAIPRIACAQSGNAALRAKRACLGCRQKKAKCDGRQPCHRCVLFDAVCEYAEGKEDRIKRRVLELEEQIDVYDQLLRRLRFKVDVHDREVIDRVLNRFSPSSFLDMRGTLEREKPMAGEQVASTETIGEQTRAGESTLIWNAQSVKIRYKSL